MHLLHLSKSYWKRRFQLIGIHRNFDQWPTRTKCTQSFPAILCCIQCQARVAHGQYFGVFRLRHSTLVHACSHLSYPLEDNCLPRGCDHCRNRLVETIPTNAHFIYDEKLANSIRYTCASHNRNEFCQTARIQKNCHLLQILISHQIQPDPF